MESYIVRIYRREENHRKLIGTVEEVGVKGQTAFTDLNELWDILFVPKSSSSRKDHRKLKESTK